jgi:1-acyl-sn-glycerol-3-phosphate acyltransferase
VSRLRPYLTLPPFALYAAGLMVVHLMAMGFGWKIARTLPVRFHRGALRALGVRVHLQGVPAAGRPLFLTANHASWLDIPVLGSVMPLTFIAKSEVASWPLFGHLAKLQRTIFIERERRSRTGEQASAIADRLVNGEAMVLFAEGTTSDGNVVLPFRSSLLGAARTAIDKGGHAHVLVQPVAIAYTRLHGMPLGRTWRPIVAWIGEEALLPHLLAIAREGAVDVTVVFGDPIEFDREGDRKSVTAHAERAVRHMLSAALLERTP